MLRWLLGLLNGLFGRRAVLSPPGFAKAIAAAKEFGTLWGAAGGWTDGHEALVKRQKAQGARSEPSPLEHPGSVRVPGGGDGGEAAVLPALPLPAHRGCNAIKTIRSQIDGKLSQSVQIRRAPPSPDSELSAVTSSLLLGTNK